MLQIYEVTLHANLHICSTPPPPPPPQSTTSSWCILQRNRNIVFPIYAIFHKALCNMKLRLPLRSNNIFWFHLSGSHRFFFNQLRRRVHFCTFLIKYWAWYILASVIVVWRCMMPLKCTLQHSKTVLTTINLCWFWAARVLLSWYRGQLLIHLLSQEKYMISGLHQFKIVVPH